MFVQRGFSNDLRQRLFNAILPPFLEVSNIKNTMFKYFKRCIENAQAWLRDALYTLALEFYKTPAGLHWQKLAEAAKVKGIYNHPNEKVPSPNSIDEVMRFMGHTGLQWTKKNSIQVMKCMLRTCSTGEVPDNNHIDWLDNDQDFFWLTKIRNFGLGGVLAIIRNEGPFPGTRVDLTTIKRIFDADVFTVPLGVPWPQPDKKYSSQPDGYLLAYNDCRQWKNLEPWGKNDVGNNIHHYERNALLGDYAVRREGSIDNTESEEIILVEDDVEDDARDGTREKPFRKVPTVPIVVSDDAQDEFASDWYDQLEKEGEFEQRVGLRVKMADGINSVVNKIKIEETELNISFGEHIAKKGIVQSYVKESSIIPVPAEIPKSVQYPQALSEIDRLWVDGNILMKMGIMTRLYEDAKAVVEMDISKLCKKKFDQMSLYSQLLAMTQIIKKLKDFHSRLSRTTADDDKVIGEMQEFVEAERRNLMVKDLEEYATMFGVEKPTPRKKYNWDLMDISQLENQEYLATSVTDLISTPSSYSESRPSGSSRKHHDSQTRGYASDGLHLEHSSYERSGHRHDERGSARSTSDRNDHGRQPNQPNPRQFQNSSSGSKRDSGNQFRDRDQEYRDHSRNHRDYERDQFHVSKSARSYQGNHGDLSPVGKSSSGNFRVPAIPVSKQGSNTPRAALKETPRKSNGGQMTPRNGGTPGSSSSHVSNHSVAARLSGNRNNYPETPRGHGPGMRGPADDSYRSRRDSPDYHNRRNTPRRASPERIYRNEPSRHESLERNRRLSRSRSPCERPSSSSKRPHDESPHGEPRGPIDSVVNNEDDNSHHGYSQCGSPRIVNHTGSPTYHRSPRGRSPPEAVEVNTGYSRAGSPNNGHGSERGHSPVHTNDDEAMGNSDIQVVDQPDPIRKNLFGYKSKETEF